MNRRRTTLRGSALAVIVACWPAGSRHVVHAQAYPSGVALQRVGADSGHDAPRFRPGVEAPASDRWFGADKLRHAGACTVIQLMGYGLPRIIGAGPTAAFVGASAVTVAAAIGKEVWDARRGGRLSGRDLVWDGVGLVLGSGLARFADPP